MKATDLRERDQVDHIIKATSQLKLEHETRSERYMRAHDSASKLKLCTIFIPPSRIGGNHHRLNLFASDTGLPCRALAFRFVGSPRVLEVARSVDTRLKGRLLTGGQSLAACFTRDQQWLRLGTKWQLPKTCAHECTERQHYD